MQQRKRCIAKRERVRVVGRDAEKMQSFVERGAVAFVGNIEDAASMTEAFNSASAVYLVLPEDISQQDLRATDAWRTSQRH